MNKEQRKFRKTTKKRKRRKDFVRKNNVIKSFIKEKEKIMSTEQVLAKLPVKFPKRRKLHKKKI